ncbi:MAG: PIG-L family deacetylase [Nitrospirae bacterium]|nr:PIG-L family deacetylase [Nitrospirota bacterium]
MRTWMKFGDWRQVMILAPHPDDETLAAGGLLQQATAEGAEVRVIFATDGDNNPWPQRVIERRWRIGAEDRARWGARRRDEAVSALTALGIPAASAIFLHYPDQGLTSLLLSGDEKPVIALTEAIAAWRPTLLVMPSELDLHPDHSALALMVRFALARLDPDQRRFTTIRYLIHGPHPPPANRDWRAFPLSVSEQTRKREAILRYASQLVLSRRRFLAFAGDRERFMISAGPVERDDHPVRPVMMEDETLRFQWAMRKRPIALGRATLYIAGENLSGGALRLSIALPRRPVETVDVHDAVDGKVIGRARLYGHRRRGEIRLPLSMLPPMEKIFVKLERRFGFFDEAGWREIPIGLPYDRKIPVSAVDRKAVRKEPVVCCVVPCYNLAAFCGDIVREAAAHADYVIAVDDGSTDGTGEILRTIAAESGGRVHRISFSTNRGKGVALLEAFQYAIEKRPFDVLITIDGDGQHRPADIPRLVRAWREEGAALVIGERVRFGMMPLRSRVGNTVTSALLRKIHPECPRDTQSGFRALDRGFVSDVVRLVQGRRYETELQVLLLALGYHRPIRTVPIQTLYLNGNRSSHFRPIRDSLRIYWMLLTWRLPVPDGDPCSDKAG